VRTLTRPEVSNRSLYQTMPFVTVLVGQGMCQPNVLLWGRSTLSAVIG